MVILLLLLLEQLTAGSVTIIRHCDQARQMWQDKCPYNRDFRGSTRN